MDSLLLSAAAVRTVVMTELSHCGLLFKDAAQSDGHDRGLCPCLASNLLLVYYCFVEMIEEYSTLCYNYLFCHDINIMGHFGMTRKFIIEL